LLEKAQQHGRGRTRRHTKDNCRDMHKKQSQRRKKKRGAKWFLFGD
jgi:hypothetical protein